MSVCQGNGSEKQIGITTLLSDKANLEPKLVSRDKDCHNILISGKKPSKRYSNYKHICIEHWSTTRLNSKTTLNYSISKRSNELNGQFSKENIQVSTNMCLASFLSHQQMWVKSVMAFHFTSQNGYGQENKWQPFLARMRGKMNLYILLVKICSYALAVIEFYVEVPKTWK